MITLGELDGGLSAQLHKRTIKRIYIDIRVPLSFHINNYLQDEITGSKEKLYKYIDETYLYLRENLIGLN